MPQSKIIPVSIEEELKSAYIDYSMSVIVSRALPDVRDGLKPVHRRVLYGMAELGLTYGKPHKKSARIVGEVLGKYHPHGDSSVYDAMVRMAQPWSMRYPLVDGQGNFGSIDGDSPAAMRYTEARLARISDYVLADIDKDTVDFAPNFDDSLKEPVVLPTRVPLLLCNGSSGIAVGMATNMAPHNLNEVVDAIKATVDNPNISIDEIRQYLKGPDFPTGGIIYGTEGIKNYMETGRGKVVVRSKAEFETLPSGKVQIVVTEIPYQVNKSQLIKKIADVVQSGKVPDIADIRDESDRQGLRIVIELKKDAIPKVVLNSLYKYTPLQVSFGVINIALVDGRPMQLNIKQLIEQFIRFRIDIIVRRTRYELQKAEERAHILEGLLIALDHIDEVIALIRSSNTVEEAKDNLMQRFELSEKQAKAILDMRLQKLTSLERHKIKEEHQELLEKIKHYKEILASETLQRNIVKEELDEVKEKFGDPRRTEIVPDEGEIRIEDIIPDSKVVITVTHQGYIKRTEISEYHTQHRGGKGARGSRTKDNDFIEHIFTASNHNYLLLFTQKGKCFWLKVYEIPEAAKNAMGRNIRNLIAIDNDDNIRAYIIVRDLNDETFVNSHYIFFATRRGVVKKTLLKAFSNPRATGITALHIDEGDRLIEAVLTDGQQHILIATDEGKAVRFHEDDVRPMGRNARGVRGITIDNHDHHAVGMIAIHPESGKTILVLSEKGLGKRSRLDDYRLTRRGSKGVITMKITAKTGKLVAIKAVQEDDDLMVSTKKGLVIRTKIRDIRIMGRASQGVKIITLKPDDAIADVAIVHATELELDEH